MKNGTLQVGVIVEGDGLHTVGICIECGPKSLTWRASVEEMRAVVSDINAQIEEADKLNGPYWAKRGA